MKQNERLHKLAIKAIEYHFDSDYSLLDGIRFSWSTSGKSWGMYSYGISIPTQTIIDRVIGVSDRAQYHDEIVIQILTHELIHVKVLRELLTEDKLTSVDKVMHYNKYAHEGRWLVYALSINEKLGWAYVTKYANYSEQIRERVA